MNTTAFSVEGESQGEAPVFSPTKIANSIAYGIMLGLIPKDNLLAFAAFVFLFLLPLNRLAAIIPTVLVSLIPWLSDPIAHPLGETLLKPQFAQPFWTWTQQLPLVPWLGLTNSVVLGGLLLSVIIYPINFLACRTVLRTVHRRALQSHVDDIVTEAIHQKHELDKQIESKIKLAIVDDRPMIVTSESDSGTAKPKSDIPAPKKSAAKRNKSPVILRFDLPSTIESKEPTHNEPVTREASAQVSAESSPNKTVSASHKSTEDNDHSSAAKLERPSSKVIANANNTIRIDTVPSASSKPTDPIKTPSLQPDESIAGERTLATASETIQVGNVVRDTVIEVVRFRPNIAPNESDKSTAAKTALNQFNFVSSLDSNANTMPEQLIAKTNTDVSSKARAASVGSDTTDSKSLDRSATTASNVTTTAFHPAEESLRFLLWHLNSANRETRE